MSPAPEGSAGRQAQWQAMARQRGLGAWSLRPTAALYGALMALRSKGYARGWLASHRLPVPVIVVGNVVVGGAGKTPTLIALVQHLRDQGWHPGVVSRGYGRHSDAVLEVTAATPARDSGDEPALIQRATGVPVYVAGQRVAAAQALLREHPHVDVLLCDDGLQHLALQRDIAIAVFDERGCGNGWLLPAGLLREPWPPARGAAYPPDVVLRQHREGHATTHIPTVPGVPVFDAARRLAAHAVGPKGQRIALKQLQGLPITAVAGIARPAVFFDMLKACGLTLAREVALADHADEAAYAALPRSSNAPLVCTEKDAVKCFAATNHGDAVPAADMWAVPLELTAEPGFFAEITSRLKALSDAR